ncbi:MAG TPA: heme-binding protein [Acidisphaera sp.]|nr:heme-binding protein [Acidisphaera sp.]
MDDQTTRIGAATVKLAGDNTVTANEFGSYRAASVHSATADRLGPLQNLPGFWEGTGFSLIARPDFSGDNERGIFLELNLLRETLQFTTIGSPVLNRGSLQSDIAIYGLTYIHRVTDGVTGGALHIEPGLWLTIPATTEPKADASVARLATIPHGNAVCTVGFVQEVVPDGLPTIPPANTVPFKIGGEPPPPGTKNPYPEYDLSIPTKFRSAPLPASITQALVNDPATMLRQALTGQHLTHITRLITNTAPADGVGNVPFITSNANTLSLESVFAIETVLQKDGTEFLQLQYAQTALLNFRGMSFPHVTVGTLIKAF